MKLRQLVHGLATYVPGLGAYRAGSTGGTVSARYCYSVWLRHLIMAKTSGLDPCARVVAELGPGDSLGIGLAALLSGCDRYLAFDVVEYAEVGTTLRVLDELASLFGERADIPADEEFPELQPALDSYAFPRDILDEARLKHGLEDSRLRRIRSSIAGARHDDSLIAYRVPWFDPDVIENESVDMIYSQAVLEHVDDLENTYKAMRVWLKPGGFLSHQIDFRCHATADEWNGHWAYSDFAWKLIRGRRPYLLNRAPYSTHLKILAKEGFHLVCDRPNRSVSKLTRNDLAPTFSFLTEDDLSTSGAFIQAVKNKAG